MIVTRDWLSEFIDLSDVSNDKLYETFNAIGLEVDSFDTKEIASKVVVGEILSCEKHPDADKLNVCQIDVGSETLQIVCGASNVVDAKYVAVAKIGAILGSDFEIKDAKLRGVESAGMVCASSELGLPDLGKGIMILDESIGVIEVGKELKEYPLFTDTIIELELTANRGDCLCILGVARDLASALNSKLFDFDMEKNIEIKERIGNVALVVEDDIDADLAYKLGKIETSKRNLLVDLRLAMVGVESKNKLDALLQYTTHSTGVILQVYPAQDDIVMLPKQKDKGFIEIGDNNTNFSTVGVKQNLILENESENFLLEASYIHPDNLAEAVFDHKLKTDDKLYYKTSRGSNPILEIGFAFFMNLTSDTIVLSSEILSYKSKRENEKITLLANEISLIVGMEIDKEKIITILEKLEFNIVRLEEDKLEITVPLFRHDIKNIQDIAEEIVRIIGINNIDSKALAFIEKPHQNSTLNNYNMKKIFKNRAVGVGFYESVSYVFSDKTLLDKYGFKLVDENLDIANPIAEELNTLRSTILINLLNGAKRNVGYSQKSIPLFEIGSIFNEKRDEHEVISFIFSGETEFDSVKNSGKPSLINFELFTQKIGSIIGNFELRTCSFHNKLIHPYQSADILIEGVKCGFISKLHPIVQEDFGLPISFICEIDFKALFPKHINATPISKFQGVSKDLSIVVAKSLTYFEVAKAINALNLTLLKDSYPVDIYEDEALGDKKSLTIRFLIQSMDKTLEDNDIENVMDTIMNVLTSSCDAELR